MALMVSVVNQTIYIYIVQCTIETEHQCHQRCVQYRSINHPEVAGSLSLLYHLWDHGTPHLGKNKQSLLATRNRKKPDGRPSIINLVIYLIILHYPTLSHILPYYPTFPWNPQGKLLNPRLSHPCSHPARLCHHDAWEHHRRKCHREKLPATSEVSWLLTLNSYPLSISLSLHVVK